MNRLVRSALLVGTAVLCSVTAPAVAGHESSVAHASSASSSGQPALKPDNPIWDVLTIAPR